jgi:hypothetical protein
MQIDIPKVEDLDCSNKVYRVTDLRRQFLSIPSGQFRNLTAQVAAHLSLHRRIGSVSLPARACYLKDHQQPHVAEQGLGQPAPVGVLRLRTPIDPPPASHRASSPKVRTPITGRLRWPCSSRAPAGILSRWNDLVKQEVGASRRTSDG